MFNKPNEKQDLQTLIQGRYQRKQDFSASLLTVQERVRFTGHLKKLSTYKDAVAEGFDINEFLNSLDEEARADFLYLLEKGTIHTL